MLILEDLISKMKVHFPRWMDIRRKVTSSSGGNYLSSIASEISEIQDYIEEYKKDFFLDKYIGNEDDVLTFIYKYHIGVAADVAILEPSYEITTDQDVFYSEEGYAYYEDGFLYTKEHYDVIQYSIDGFISTQESEKMHVWNIFDEFAIFVGLRRYQWETNSELLNRILAFSTKRANSTDDGLKNAILNNLINFDDSITVDDIEVSRPTAENLIKYYDNTETILDHLSLVNRDVYRTKRWDVDTWNFAIKSIDYIPHAWDVILNSYANGVGFEEDLKVEIVDASSKTNATIYFYKQTIEYINSYIKNNNIKETVKLDLVKHSDSLVPTNVKYRAIATELEPFDPDKIPIESYDYRIGTFELPIETLFDEKKDEHYGIEVIENSRLKPGLRYVLNFKSIKELDEMSIDKLYVYNEKENETKSALIDMDGFEHTVQDGVRCTLTKRSLTEKYQFSSSSNVIKTTDGFEILNAEEKATLVANVDACQNEEVFYEYEYDETPVLFSNITRKNCYVQDNKILSDTVHGEKYISVDLEANSFSCLITGPHRISYSVNGVIQEDIERKGSGVNTFKIEGYDTPQKLSIMIHFTSEDINYQGTVSDILYSSYEFSIYTKYGELNYVGGQKRLPSVMYNTLYVDMKTNTGFSPVLKYIYIGTKVNNITYGPIEIVAEEGDMLIISSSNCRIEMEAFSEENDLEEFDFNFVSTKTIVGTTDESYITLDISGLKSMLNIEAEACTYENDIYGTSSQHTLKIPNGHYLKTATVTGELEKMIFRETVGSVLSRKGYEKGEYNFYSAKTCDEIIARDEHGELHFLKIKRNDLISNATAKIKIDSSSESLQPVFIEDGENKTTVIVNEFDMHYDYITFYPSKTKIYKAINEYNIISQDTIVPSIINTFDNGFSGISEYSLFYTIETLNSDFDVHFCKNANKTSYSFDNSPILIHAKDIDMLGFDYDELSVAFESVIGNSVLIPEMFVSGSEKVEVAKYIITNEDLNIKYLDRYSDVLHEKDYIATEVFTINSLMCNKLKYCNINEIEEIVINNVQVPSNSYSLYKKEGIILWNSDANVSVDEKVTITYNILKPSNIIISVDELYEKVNFSVNAYELLSTMELLEVNDSEKYNLATNEDYEKCDLISVKCSNIGFEAEVNGALLTFRKSIANNTLALKAGYYYLDGDEYYLFSDENSNDIEQLNNMKFFNVTKENKMLHFNQTTMNKVTNSSLSGGTNGEMFRLNCSNKDIQGISKINAITTCENFNYWKTVGMNAAIVDGLNGLGVKFTSISAFDGHAYLDITNHLEKDGKQYTISFYKQGGTAYLGEENRLSSYANEFNKRTIVNIKAEAVESPIEDDIYEVTFINGENKNYYLVITGDCVIDDILVQETELHDVSDHKKNISSLNLDIVENIYANYQTRLYLDDANGAIFNGTEKKEQTIINSSYIEWGFTKAKEISSYTAFTECVLKNVDLVQHNDTCYVKTLSESGVLTTGAIYIGNVNVISNLLFKINDVMFDTMTGFRIKLLTSSNASTGFKEVATFLDNIGTVNGDDLLSYVKLMVEMPTNKVIDNIELFIEYLSDDSSSPSEVPVINGEYISKVLDARYNERFLVNNFVFDSEDTNIKNLTFFIRASKENTKDTVWTDWKEVIVPKDGSAVGKVENRIVFDGYRYFQFKTVLKEENSSVKIKYIDLEVI